MPRHELVEVNPNFHAFRIRKAPNYYLTCTFDVVNTCEIFLADNMNLVMDAWVLADSALKFSADKLAH